MEGKTIRLSFRDFEKQSKCKMGRLEIAGFIFGQCAGDVNEYKSEIERNGASPLIYLWYTVSKTSHEPPGSDMNVAKTCK